MKSACVCVMMLLSGVSGACGQQPDSTGKAPAAPAAAPAPAPATQDGASAERSGTGRVFDLHPKWVVGDVQRFTYELMNFNGAQAADDATKRSGQLFRQEGRLVRKVISSDEKGTTLGLTIERLYLQESRNTKVQYYDSDLGDDPNKQTYLTPRVKRWMGKTITVKLDPAGEVLGVEGLLPLPAGPAADAKPTGEAVDIDESIVRKMWRPLYRLDKPGLTAKIGETWTTREQSGDAELGTFDLSIRHELKDVLGGLATIESQAEVKHTPSGEPQSMHAKLTSSSLKGTYEWDMKRGMLRSWSTEQEMKMDAERSGAKLVLSSKSVTNFKWVDPDAPKEEAQPGGKVAGDGGAPAAPAAAGTTGKP